MRHEFTDHERAAIKPMLPNKPRGVPRVNDRRVLNGIFWVLRSAHRGAICRRRLAPILLAIIGSFAGVTLAPVSAASRIACATWLPSFPRMCGRSSRSGRKRPTTLRAGRSPANWPLDWWPVR